MERDPQQNVGLILSLLIHAAVFLLFWWHIPLGTLPTDPPHPIPVDVVPIDEISKAPALKPKPVPKPTPSQPVKKKEPEKPQPEMDKKEEPLLPKQDPQPVEKSEPKPKPEDLGLLKQETKPALEKAEKQPDQPKPKKETKKQEKKSADSSQKELRLKPKKDKPQRRMDDLLKNLEETSDDGIDQLLDQVDPHSDSVNAASQRGSLSMSELDVLRRQIKQCWRVPAAAKDASDLYVVLELEMHSDATVKSVRPVPQKSSTSHPLYQTGMESAMRAVQDPRCSPLKLPLKKYDSWKTFTFRFSPRM